jgi:hypothetical protein
VVASGQAMRHLRTQAIKSENQGKAAILMNI